MESKEVVSMRTVTAQKAAKKVRLTSKQGSGEEWRTEGFVVRNENSSG